MLAAGLLLVHLVSFAAYISAGFAQQQLLKRSRSKDIAPAARDELERIAAGVVTKIELPAIMGSIASGIGFIIQNPAVMKFGWLHGKLACVLLLALLSHAEMFNARKIVKARAANNSTANETEIDARKKRHEQMGTLGALLVVVVLVLVTFVRLSP